MKKVVIISLCTIMHIKISSQPIIYLSDSTNMDIYKRELSFTKECQNEMLHILEISGQTVEYIKIKRNPLSKDYYGSKIEVDGYISGITINGLKEGIWDFKDINGKHLQSYIYCEDTLIITIQLNKRKRIDKILFHTTVPAYYDYDVIVIQAEIIPQVMYFNKRGKAIKKASLLHPGTYFSASPEWDNRTVFKVENGAGDDIFLENY